MLVSKQCKQLKIGSRVLTVKSYKFWALLYSSHGEMNILFLSIILHISAVFATYSHSCLSSLLFIQWLHLAAHPAKILPFSQNFVKI